MEQAKATRTYRGNLVVGWMIAGLMMPLPYLPSVVALGVAIAGVAGLRSTGAWKRLASAWFIRFGRLARRSDRILRTTVQAETLWLVGAVGLVTSAGISPWYPEVAELALSCGVYTFALGGALYAGSVGLRLGQLAWVRATGKIAIGIMAAVFVCISRSAASEIVASIIHADAKAFPVFLDLVTALLTPCLMVATAIAFTLILAALGIAAVLLRALVKQAYPGQWLLGAIAKIPGLRSRRQRDFSILPTPFGIRMAAAFVAAALTFLAAVYAVREGRESLANLATDVLVYADFHARVACDGVAHNDRVAFIGQGRVVVARPVDDGRWSFGEQACRLGPGAVDVRSKLASEMGPQP